MSEDFLTWLGEVQQFFCSTVFVLYQNFANSVAIKRGKHTFYAVSLNFHFAGLKKNLVGGILLVILLHVKAFRFLQCVGKKNPSEEKSLAGNRDFENLDFGSLDSVVPHQKVGVSLTSYEHQR